MLVMTLLFSTQPYPWRIILFITFYVIPKFAYECLPILHLRKVTPYCTPKKYLKYSHNILIFYWFFFFTAVPNIFTCFVIVLSITAFLDNKSPSKIFIIMLNIADLKLWVPVVISLKLIPCLQQEKVSMYSLSLLENTKCLNGKNKKHVSCQL